MPFLASMLNIVGIVFLAHAYVYLQCFYPQA